MPNAVLDTATGTGYAKRFGFTDFTSQLGPDETQVVVNGAPIAGTPLRYQTVVGGVFQLLSAPDQSAVDASIDAAKAAALQDAVVISRVFQNLADLPVPPPVARALVVIINGPGGMPGLAISTPTGYVLFAADAVHP